MLEGLGWEVVWSEELMSRSSPVTGATFIQSISFTPSSNPLDDWSDMERTHGRMEIAGEKKVSKIQETKTCHSLQRIALHSCD